MGEDRDGQKASLSQCVNLEVKPWEIVKDREASYVQVHRVRRVEQGLASEQ